MIERPSRIWTPRTGQTVSYANYDDGYYEAGNPRATRYINNGNNTVTDLAQGLMFIRDHDAMGAPFNAKMTQAAALTNIATLNGSGYAGHSDWRLPNIFALELLVDWGRYNPCIDPIFVGAHGDWYWASTTLTPNYITLGPCVLFTTGVVASQAKSTYAAYVRPVRGGRLNG